MWATVHRYRRNCAFSIVDASICMSVSEVSGLPVHKFTLILGKIKLATKKVRFLVFSIRHV